MTTRAHERCPRCGGGLVYSFPVSSRGGRPAFDASREVGYCFACGWDQENKSARDPQPARLDGGAT